MELKEGVKMDFFVDRHKTIRSQDGTKFKLILKHGNGHKLTFTSDDEDVFEGVPPGAVITITLTNPQRTLSELDKE